MVAARTLGWTVTGLAGIVESRFGVHLSKKHQRADWGRRPLTKAQVQYARLDTHFLISLRDLQWLSSKRLEERKRRTMNSPGLPVSRVLQARPILTLFWRVKGSRDLTPAQAAVLRELYLYRDHHAENQTVHRSRSWVTRRLWRLRMTLPTACADCSKSTA